MRTNVINNYSTHCANDRRRCRGHDAPHVLGHPTSGAAPWRALTLRSRAATAVFISSILVSTLSMDIRTSVFCCRFSDTKIGANCESSWAPVPVGGAGCGHGGPAGEEVGPGVKREDGAEGREKAAPPT